MTARFLWRAHQARLLDQATNLKTGSVMDCFRHLGARDYAGQFIQNGRPKAVAEFDLAVHQSQVGGRFWRNPDYSNTLLFKPI